MFKKHSTNQSSGLQHRPLWSRASKILANVQSTAGFGSSDIRKIAQVWKIKMLTIAEANALLARNPYPYSPNST